MERQGVSEGERALQFPFHFLFFYTMQVFISVCGLRTFSCMVYEEEEDADLKPTESIVLRINIDSCQCRARDLLVEVN